MVLGVLMARVKPGVVIVRGHVGRERVDRATEAMVLYVLLEGRWQDRRGVASWRKNEGDNKENVLDKQRELLSALQHGGEWSVEAVRK
jgi:hypothetical protein